MRTFLKALFVALSPLVAVADIPSTQGKLVVSPVVTGLNAPWGFAFLPDGGVMITEKGGQLLVVKDGNVDRVRGLPPIHVEGQGGLLDVLVPRDFAQTREVYVTHAVRQGRGAGTALTKATISRDLKRLSNVTTIFETTPGSSGGRHFGSRLAEGTDGKIYMTVGDRGDRPSAQDRSNENGSVLRLNRDGTVPSDNPFAGSAIWSFGHRNPQGLAFGPDGRLWGIEHGASGGDEINLVQKGRNYGWPVIAYGRHYSGAKIGEGTAKPGLQQPAHFWDPSIAPSGAMVYTGKMFPGWKGHIFTGSLKFDSIHLSTGYPQVSEVEILKSPETQRVRDIREAPDGSIWFLNEPDGILYRISK